MLERQPAGRRDERGKLVRTIADDRNAPRLECLQGCGQLKNRLESGADDDRAVGSSQFVQVGGDIESLGGRAMNSAQPARDHNARFFAQSLCQP